MGGLLSRVEPRPSWLQVVHESRALLSSAQKQVTTLWLFPRGLLMVLEFLNLYASIVLSGLYSSHERELGSCYFALHNETSALCTYFISSEKYVRFSSLRKQNKVFRVHISFVPKKV
jgi:hypothetical protein